MHGILVEYFSSLQQEELQMLPVKEILSYFFILEIKRKNSKVHASKS